MIQLDFSNDEFNIEKCNLIGRFREYFDEKFDREDTEDDAGAIYVDDRMVEFQFVYVKGAKSVREGSYVLVTVEDGGSDKEDDPNDKMYLIRFDVLTKPAFNGPKIASMTFDKFLMKNCAVDFSRHDYVNWVENGSVMELAEGQNTTPVF